MIKGVLFDYGGVVAEGGKGSQIAHRLCLELDLPADAAQTVFMPLFKPFIRGQIDDAAFWAKVESKTNRQFSVAQRQTWNDWWGVEPYPEMLATVQSLKVGGIQVGLLSNIFPPNKAKIEVAGGYRHFDFIVLSCEVGYAKPDTEIYDLAISNFEDLQSEEIVFIDDQPKYLVPAQDLGMETILATSSEQIIIDLRKLHLPA